MSNLTGSRDVAWRFDLFDLAGNRIGQLPGVVSGEFTASTGSVIRTGGRLRWKRPPGTATPDWLRVMVQPVYTASFPDGTAMEWPLGLFIPAAPKMAVDGSVVSADVELYDRLLVLDEDAFDETFSVPAGAIVTDAVRAILDGAGVWGYIVEDSALTLAAPAVWEGGTSRLRVINDLLDAIGYFSLWVDGTGTFRAEPYVPPLQRPVSWVFADGATAIYTPGHSEDRDTFGVPNRVVVVARSTDGTAEPLMAVAENNDETDRLSIPSRGRVITRRYDGVDAASQEVLDAMAARYLAAARNTGSVVEIEHLPLPLDLVDLNSRVDFKNAVSGASLTGVVTAYTVRTEVPAFVTTTIREITA